MGAAAGFGGLGQILQVVGSIASQLSYGNSQADAYEANARMAEMDAAAARTAAEASAQQQNKINQAHLGSVRSGILGNGITLEGTPLLMIEEEARQGELARLNELYKGEITATKYENEASMQRFYGDQAQSASFTKAIGSLSKAGTSLLGGK